MLDALLAARSGVLLVAFEFRDGREQRPTLAVLQAHVPTSPCHRRLEREPALDDAVLLGRIALNCNGVRARLLQGGPKQVSNPRPAFYGGDVPGERDQVTPVA